MIDFSTYVLRGADWLLTKTGESVFDTAKQRLLERWGIIPLSMPGARILLNEYCQRLEERVTQQVIARLDEDRLIKLKSGILQLKVSPGTSFYQKSLADAHNIFLEIACIPEYGETGGLANAQLRCIAFLGLAVVYMRMNDPQIEIAKNITAAIYADSSTAEEWFGRDIVQELKQGANFTGSIALPPPKRIVQSTLTYSQASTTSQSKKRRVPVWVLIVVSIFLVIAGSGVLSFFIINASPPNPYPPHTGTLALNDPLRDNSKGYNWEWDETTDQYGGSCQFTADGYRVSMPDPTSSEFCPAQNINFSNFAFEVQMRIIQGDSGDIMFRAAPSDGFEETYYIFWVTQDGNYELDVCSPGTCTQLINLTDSSAINMGLDQTNLIAVVANANTITLFVNNQQIDSVTDNTYSQGQIGVIASPYYKTGQPTEVLYSDAKVWTF